ncbi:C2H2-type zinc finger protein, partial [Kistimonas scapharcae]|uniref:C2H2-type zinc finger protein n=1 Tax=Kistimonas scapharcae TaxID=1036133 RepID=UPI0031EF0238
PSAVAGTSGVQSGYSRQADNQFKCNQCEYSTKVLTNIKKHVRIHTGEKPYKCQYCEKFFSQHIAKVVHERTHTSEEPYKCELCNYSAKQLSNLNVHMSTKHPSQQAATDTNQPPAKKPKTE